MTSGRDNDFRLTETPPVGPLLSGAFLPGASDVGNTPGDTHTPTPHAAGGSGPTPLARSDFTNSYMLSKTEHASHALVAGLRASGPPAAPRFPWSEYEAKSPSADAEDLVAAYLADLDDTEKYFKAVDILLNMPWKLGPDFDSRSWIGKVQGMLGLARVPRRLWARFVLTVNRDREDFSVFFPLLARLYADNYDPAGIDTWEFFTKTVLRDNRTLLHQIKDWDAMYDWSKADGTWTSRWEKWFVLLTKVRFPYHPALAHRFCSQLPKLVYQSVLHQSFLDYTALYNFVHPLLGPVDVLNATKPKSNLEALGKQSKGDNKPNSLGKTKDVGLKPGLSNLPTSAGASNLSNTHSNLSNTPSNLSFH